MAEDTKLVSREVADAAIAAAEANGAVAKSFCTSGTGNVLRKIPGFESAPNTMQPMKMRDWFMTLPGVVSKQYRDGDPANNHDVLLRQRGKITAAGNVAVPQP